MKTIVCHFYNEEYLLPWWLNHHKQFFDHGLMINYASTDNSTKIIKTICPTWDIIDSKNIFFVDYLVDKEIEEYERTINGWRICLNVTEFLFGDFSTLIDIDKKIGYNIPCVSIIDDIKERKSYEIDKKLPLYEQIKTGLSIEESIKEYGYRRIANHAAWYPLGRHFKSMSDNCQFIILKYTFAPMTDEFLTRKLQIQYKIPYQDKNFKIFRAGHYHTDYGRGLTKEKLLTMYDNYTKEDISEIIDKFVKITHN